MAYYMAIGLLVHELAEQITNLFSLIISIFLNAAFTTAYSTTCTTA